MIKSSFFVNHNGIIQVFFPIQRERISRDKEKTHTSRELGKFLRLRTDHIFRGEYDN